MMKVKDAAELFWPNVNVGWTDDCWEWRLSRLPNGYGQFSSGRNRNMSTLAHRVAYEMLVGSVPDGMQVDHLCHNKMCCNPQHLEAVTAQINTQRAHDDGLIKNYRNGNSDKTQCKNGHPFDLVTPSGRRLCRTCRNNYARDYQRRKRALASSRG